MNAGMGLVRPGSTIIDVYYAVPQHYAQGDRFETFREAVEAAHEKWRIATEQVVKANGDDPDRPWGWGQGATVGEYARNVTKIGCVVDLRWKIAGPEGWGSSGSMDTVIDRGNVAHLDAEHWARMDRMQALT